MGQYYNPVIVDEENNVKAWMYSHDYDSGLKLMEHSWIKNDFVRSFESLLVDTPKSVVWAGDYADEDEGATDNLYCLCEDDKKVNPESSKQYRYIVNHSKMEYIDKNNGVEDADGWQIHPLPLMTCEGNGQGGGDFGGNDPNNLVGSWARDLISVATRKPSKDFKEVLFTLIEED